MSAQLITLETTNPAVRSYTFPHIQHPLQHPPLPNLSVVHHCLIFPPSDHPMLRFCPFFVSSVSVPVSCGGGGVVIVVVKNAIAHTAAEAAVLSLLSLLFLAEVVVFLSWSTPRGRRRSQKRRRRRWCGWLRWPRGE